MKMNTRDFIVLMSYKDECIDFLEEKSREGYQLERIGFFKTEFSECSQPLKYQISYNLFDDEYLGIVRELGYEILDFHDKIFIYVNKDLNAPDLESDDEVYQQTLLNRFKISYIALFAVIGFVILNLFATAFSLMLPLTKGSLYIDYDSMLLMLALIYEGLYMILNAVYLYMKRRSVLHMTYSYKKWHRIDLMHHFLSNVAIVLFIMIVITHLEIPHLNGIIVAIIIIEILTKIVLLFSMLKKVSQKVLTAIIVVVGCFFGSVVEVVRDDDQYALKGVNESFPQYEDITYENENHFVYVATSLSDILEYNKLEDLYERKYYECLNEDVSLSVFEYEIVETERLSRMQENELAKELIENSGYKKKSEKSLSYKDALSKYQKYDSMYFDECYVMDNFVVARYKNIVVRIVVDNVEDIDKILESYYVYSTKNAHS